MAYLQNKEKIVMSYKKIFVEPNWRVRVRFGFDNILPISEFGFGSGSVQSGIVRVRVRFGSGSNPISNVDGDDD